MTPPNAQQNLNLDAVGYDPMQKLVVDRKAPALPRVWSIAGTIWAVLHLLILLFGGDPNSLIVSSLTGLVVAIGASVSGQVPRLRSHPAALPGLLFAVVLLGSLFLPGVTDPGSFIVRQYLLFALGVLVPPWVLRSRRSLLVTTLAALLFATLLALRSAALGLPASWIIPRSVQDATIPLLPYRYAAYTAVQLLLITLAVPWVIAAGRKAVYAAALPLAVIVYSIAALAFELPGWLQALPDRLVTWDLASPATSYTPLLWLILAWVLAVLVKQALKEWKRWSERGYLAGVVLGGSLGAALLVLLLFALPQPAYPWVMTTAGFTLGLGFAARERLIHEDETRHPRRRPTPLAGYFEEAGILLMSLLAALWRKISFHTPAMPDGDPPRRVIASSSPRLHSPYETGRPRWIPLALHMHSNRWEGAFTPRETVDHYSRIGAGGVILTDHNRRTVTGHPFARVPAYEHGWGPHHHHVLTLGAERTLVDRYPYGGPVASRAETIARLRGISKVLVLAHPGHRDAWGAEDVTALDYDALEVFNKSMDDFAPWDQALTSGLLVWGTAGDDCHDLRSRHQTGKRYLLLDLRRGSEIDRDGSIPPEAVYKALKQGRFVAVRQMDRSITRHLPHEELPMIERFDWLEGVLTIQFDRPVNYAEIVGPGGEVTGTFRGEREFRVAPPEGRGYARLVVFHGDHTLALNPVARIRENANLDAL